MDRGFILDDDAGKPVRIVGGISDVTEQRQAEQALENSHRQLRALSARLQSVREEERAKVAREIHDELGQVLTALKINLDWLERKLGVRDTDTSLNPLLDRVVESAEIADSAISSVQKIASELRPSSLDNLGLAAALEQEARRFQQRTGIACRVNLPADSLELPRRGGHGGIPDLPGGPDQRGASCPGHSRFTPSCSLRPSRCFCWSKTTARAYARKR